jgi:hypothetical protein
MLTVGSAFGVNGLEYMLPVGSAFGIDNLMGHLEYMVEVVVEDCCHGSDQPVAAEACCPGSGQVEGC